jgi:hypothetical protein
LTKSSERFRFRILYRDDSYQDIVPNRIIYRFSHVLIIKELDRKLEVFVASCLQGKPNGEQAGQRTILIDGPVEVQMESDIKITKHSNGSAFPVEEAHFDEEATLLARRVVPISGAHSPSIGLSPARRTRRLGIPLLLAIAIIVGATVIGLVGGLMIAGRRHPNENATPVAAAEPASAEAPDTLAAKDQSPAVNVQRKEDVTNLPANTDRVVPTKEQKPLVVTTMPARTEPAGETANRQADRPAMHRKVKTRTEDRQVEDRRDDSSGDVDERKATRREERRQRRVKDGDLGNREIRHAGREIDRIRDIFLGTP